MFDRDSRRFAEWVQQFQPFLYRAAWALIGERGAAQDLVQETFTIAWRARHQLRESGAAQAWLYRILRREAIRYWREQEPWEEWQDEICEAVPGNIVATDGQLDVLEALQTLSLPHREVLTLFYLADMSYDQLGFALEIPAGTVMSRLNRARSALRRALEENQND
jgi:RNA polymerase sigma-70 factor (ECF subfamily)